MADAISPRRQCPDWPSSAAAAYGRQHYCAAGPVRPVPDHYAIIGDRQTIEQTNRRTTQSRKGLITDRQAC